MADSTFPANFRRTTIPDEGPLLEFKGQTVVSF